MSDKPSTDIVTFGKTKQVKKRRYYKSTQHFNRGRAYDPQADIHEVPAFRRTPIFVKDRMIGYIVGQRSCLPCSWWQWHAVSMHKNDPFRLDEIGIIGDLGRTPHRDKIGLQQVKDGIAHLVTRTYLVEGDRR